MEELKPEELEELVQELQEESEEAETLSPEVEELLRDLQPARRYSFRRRAAKQLGEVSRSSRQVVQALVTAAETDSAPAVRAMAAESLRAPVHQEILREYPELGEQPQSAAQPRGAAQPVTRPAHFQVEDKGGTLSLSWKEGLRHKVLSAGLTALLLLVLGNALFASSRSGEGAGLVVLAVALALSGYWALVAFVNSAQITLSRKEWIFQRGPFPFPNRSLYSGTARIDPAACSEVWTVPVEEKRPVDVEVGGGRRSSIGDAIFALLVELLLELLLAALVALFMPPRTTDSLYARARDGTEKLLLARLQEHEAAYLKHTLQDMLDTGGGALVRE